jgi:hypothetical protein
MRVSPVERINYAQAVKVTPHINEGKGATGKRRVGGVQARNGTGS